MLSDGHWSKIELLLPGKESDCGVTAKDNRLFLEAVLWINRIGSPWRDLPQYFGDWHRVYVRYTAGHVKEYGSGYSKHLPLLRVSSLSISTAPSPEYISTAPRKKRKRRARTRPFARRPDHENTRCGRCQRQFGALYHYPRPAVGFHQGRGFDRGLERMLCRCRQGR